MNSLEIKNLHVEADNKEILKGISYKFETGKIYAIIGPNGNGKSTLLSSIMGDPNFAITSGDILLNGQIINDWEPDKRSRAGIYLCMQHPSEIEGISNISLLKSAMDVRTQKKNSTLSIALDAKVISKKIRQNDEMLMRDVNVGFSGGEKKKNELMQTFMLKPTFSFLDEIDSGLDVDSIRAVSLLIKEQKNKEQSFVIVSHYKELYECIKPDVVLIIENGKIKQTGDYDLLMETLNKGFQ